MIDYEEMIYEKQESEDEECSTCPYKGKECRSQCMKDQLVYNPMLKMY